MPSMRYRCTLISIEFKPTKDLKILIDALVEMFKMWA